MRIRRLIHVGIDSALAMMLAACGAAATPSAGPTPFATAPLTVPASTVAATSVPASASPSATPVFSANPPQPMQTISVLNLEGSVNIDGRTRFYILHVPRGTEGRESVPLVIILHGQGENASRMMQTTQMDLVADQQKFLTVYPEGTGTSPAWNAGFCCGDAMQNKVDDVGFMRKLIESLNGSYPINPQQVYVVGVGNGAMLAYRLGVELSDQLAAIATINGTMDEKSPQPRQPLSTMAVNGTADPEVNYERAAQAIQFWVQADGCASTPQRDESSRAIRESYSNCKAGTSVIFITIKGGDHSWPATLPPLIGGITTSAQTPTANLIWDFFASHPQHP